VTKIRTGLALNVIAADVNEKNSGLFRSSEGPVATTVMSISSSSRNCFRTSCALYTIAFGAIPNAKAKSPWPYDTATLFLKIPGAKLGELMEKLISVGAGRKEAAIECGVCRASDSPWRSRRSSDTLMSPKNLDITIQAVKAGLRPKTFVNARYDYLNSEELLSISICGGRILI
jgi:hypothetical protein